MKIIGHRGAAGIALENTLASFAAAQKIGVDAIELDVRKTMDGQLVVCHNPDTRVIAKRNSRINLTTYDALKQIVLNDGKSTIPKLSDALKSIKNTPVMIEIKEEGCMPALSKVVDNMASDDYIVVSFKTNELPIFKASHPQVKTFGLTHSHPLKLINQAKQLGLNGIGVSFWVLNPLTYRLAKQKGLEIYVYTINSRALAGWIRRLYPDVSICTDRPDKLADFRDKVVKQ